MVKPYIKYWFYSHLIKIKGYSSSIAEYQQCSVLNSPKKRKHLPYSWYPEIHTAVRDQHTVDTVRHTAVQWQELNRVGPQIPDKTP